MYLNVSLKAWTPWLGYASILLFAVYIIAAAQNVGHRSRTVFAAGLLAYTCQALALWIQGRYKFETLRPPGAKWYLPWRRAQFSIPDDTRIHVRDIDSVAHWYRDKLGLRRLSENRFRETGIATFRFKADGKSVILDTRAGFRTVKTPILFTKKIGKLREVLAARGASVEDVRQDRQGICYFEMRDPEGNEIEVVQER